MPMLACVNDGARRSGAIRTVLGDGETVSPLPNGSGNAGLAITTS